MSVLRYRPEEFHGLTHEEAEVMKASGLSRVEWDRSRLMTAHGDLCGALIHLQRARDYFRRENPAMASALAPIIADLDPLIPDYTDFSLAFRRMRR